MARGASQLSADSLGVAMKSAVNIRAERSGDVDAIGGLIGSAFSGMPYADGDEADLVEVLRARDALLGLKLG
jgi:predicted N-acetyltransferase YhbS